MYFDEIVLKIIFKIPDDNISLLEDTLKHYTETIQKISEEVMDEYFKNIEITKRKHKGFVELMKTDPNDPNISDEKKEEVFLKAMLTAADTPEYQKMVAVAIKAFHETLVKDQLEKLTKKERKQLYDYLEDVKENVKENAKILDEIIDKMDDEDDKDKKEEKED